MTELPQWEGEGDRRPVCVSPGPSEAEAPGLLFMERLLFEARKSQDDIKQYWRNGSFEL